jgi:hypothetical protein
MGEGRARGEMEWERVKWNGEGKDGNGIGRREWERGREDEKEEVTSNTN